jgi:hypothetical protein
METNRKIHKENIQNAIEMMNLAHTCAIKIDFLINIKNTYGDCKVSEIIESLENQMEKFNKNFKELIKKD